MPFGIKSAQEVFQKHISQEFGDLPGVETDNDNTLIWVTTKTEHDEHLEAVLQWCEKINLTLNEEKCKLGVTEVMYIGHVLTPEGIHPDPDKIKAIQNMSPPTDKKDIERLLGTVNYFAKFIPNMSTIMLLIRDILKKEIPFYWDLTQEESFSKLKNILSSTPVLTFYDVNKPVIISCDASQSGFGVLLLQDGKPVAYVSRAISSTEKCYAQIEKKLLAVDLPSPNFTSMFTAKMSLSN